jgi:thiol-disulfide isomerase/thioredoxin
MKQILLKSIIIICVTQNVWAADVYKATIRFVIKNSNAPITLNYNEYKDGLLKYKIDTLKIINGIAQKTISLSKPIYIQVRNDSFAARVFVAPNYKSTFVVDAAKKVNGSNVPIVCTGDGKIANDYLSYLNNYMASPKTKIKGKAVTEEEYLMALDKYFVSRDSVYAIYKKRFETMLRKDPHLSFFFDTEQTNIRFCKGGLLLNFASNRHYRWGRAVNFYKKYVEPLNLHKEQVTIDSYDSRFFFGSYFLNYHTGRGWDTDSAAVAARGAWTYSLKLATEMYDGMNRTWAITTNLYFFVQICKAYPENLPPIPSLIEEFGGYISPSDKAYLLAQYQQNCQPNKIEYAENQIIEDFEISDIKKANHSFKVQLSKVTFVDLWATWCGNCIEAFPDVEQLAAHYASNPNVSFMKLSLDAKQEKWQATCKRLQLTDSSNNFWIGGEMNSTFSKQFRVGYLPRIMLLNQEGKILKLFAPDPRGDGKKRLITLIDEHLK